MSYEHPWEAIADELAAQQAKKERETITEISDSCEDFLAFLEPSKMLRREAVVCDCANDNMPGLLTVSECVRCWQCM